MASGLLHLQPQPAYLPPPAFVQVPQLIHAAAAQPDGHAGSTQTDAEHPQAAKRLRLIGPDTPTPQGPAQLPVSHTTDNRRAASALRQAMAAKGLTGDPAGGAPDTGQQGHGGPLAASQDQQPDEGEQEPARLPAAQEATAAVSAASSGNATVQDGCAKELLDRTRLRPAPLQPGQQCPPVASQPQSVLENVETKAKQHVAPVLGSSTASTGETCPPCLLAPEASGTGLLFLGTGCAEPSKYR